MKLNNNSLRKRVVTYKLAKALSKLNYDFKTDKVYENEKLRESGKADFTQELVLAPYLSDVKEWLRETKNIHLYVYPKIVEPNMPIKYNYTIMSTTLIDNNQHKYSSYYLAIKCAVEGGIKLVKPHLKK